MDVKENLFQKDVKNIVVLTNKDCRFKRCCRADRHANGITLTGEVRAITYQRYTRLVEERSRSRTK